jgi:hypothetical protein
MAFPNVTDIVATTIQSRSGKLADNTLRQNALLNWLNKKGRVKTFSGGNVITQELMYNDPTTQNAGSYSGYDVIDITPNSPISWAQFDIKQYAAAVSASGLDLLQNSGKEKIIDLLEGRIEVSEKQGLLPRIHAGHPARDERRRRNERLFWPRLHGRRQEDDRLLRRWYRRPDPDEPHVLHQQ